MTEFSKNLAAAIERARLTQVEVAKRAGLTECTISRYVNGTRSPNSKNIKKLCDILHITPNDLFNAAAADEAQRGERFIYCPYCGKKLERGSNGR